MRIIDEYRLINVENNDWTSPVEDVFCEKMSTVGVTVESIEFTFNWSPSDGTCFAGYVSDWSKFLSHLGYDDEKLIDYAQKNFIFKSKFDPRYPYNENSMKFQAHIKIDDKELRHEYSPDFFHDQFVDFFYSAAEELYNMLLDKYEYLTSDEAVLETLEINNILIENK